MAKRKREYYPPEAQMGYSGVHARELAELVKWLESVGANDIAVGEDDGEYDEPGPWHVVQYKR